MRYRYTFTIEDVKNEQEMLFLEGTINAKSYETCLKSVRRDITSSIRDKLNHIEQNLQET